MIEVMKTRGHDVKLKSSLSLALILMVAYSYVDDSDLPLCSTDNKTTGEELQEKFQSELDIG